ncbi:sensor histidine kinase [Marinimicrobium agarilyticum]|uniref:sensor histidine kinase n=1 Tax=Marinimicrobium agarilyticum TaxID=306546 RepID=UPI0003FBF578|nr:ATP-binding protein [Marinimicrobium agarilyticum]
MRLGFTHKLILITALASGLVWLVFGGVFYQVAKHSLEDQLAKQQVAKARDLMQDVDRSLFSARQGIQVVAQERPLIQFLSAGGTESTPQASEMSDDLESISLLTGPWKIVSVLSDQGRLLVSNMPERAGRLVQEHPEFNAAFQAAKKGEIYSSELRFVGEGAAASLIFTAPVYSGGLEESDVIGVALGKYAWPAVNQLLDDVDRDVGAQLLRSDGVVIAASSHYRDRVGSKASEWPILQKAGFSSRSGSIVLDNRDEPEEVSSIMVAVHQKGHLGYEGQDWTLVLEVPFESMLAPVYRLAYQLALLALVGVLVLCGVLYVSVTYLMRPLVEMSGKVRAFAQGDFSARLDLGSRPDDEISRVGETFNTMAEDISFYIEQVQENSEEVRAFAYIVSHDLRAPLVNLKGFATELGYSNDELRALLEPTLQTLPQATRDEAAVIWEQDIPEALQFMHSSVASMDRQIQAILALSRLGRRELVWESVDSKAVVTEQLASLKHQLEAKEIEVDIGELPVVTADVFALEQVFRNLLDNAVKYMDTTPGHLVIRSEDNNLYWTFHVSDNGPGIDPSNLTKVFELFRRVGNTEVAGDGMGLAYVKTLVRRHGGRIWCESVVGEGSTFSFTLAKNASERAARSHG